MTVDIFACILFHLISCIAAHKEPSGHCAMYGECGVSPLTNLSVPCKYNGPAKPLTDPRAKSLLQELCPDLAREPSTCCDSSQLYELQMRLNLLPQILGACPACLYNFRNIYCYMLCHPHQSNYLAVTRTFNSTKQLVLETQYDVTKTFSNNMYNSCKNVKYPTFAIGKSEKALGILCGHSANDCSPKKLLDYIGNTGNGQTPFAIKFNITDHKDTLPSGVTLYPMNATTIPCSSPVGNKSACLFSDCSDVRRPTPPTPMFPCNSKPNEKHRQRPSVTMSGYEAVSLVIQRRGHLPKIHHEYPPPFVGNITFNAVFNKKFLHQILDLQLLIQNATFRTGQMNVSLQDVCLLGVDSKHCVVRSMLQYFQNSHDKINKVIKDQFFVYEIYLDHLLYCFKYPNTKNESLLLHMSCLPDYGKEISPAQVLCGYDENNYQNSTALVMTFILKDPRTSAASAAWRTGMLGFVEMWQFIHSDVYITLYHDQFNL